MILLSISPFIFIQCGSGGGREGGPGEKGKGAARGGRGGAGGGCGDPSRPPPCRPLPQFSSDYHPPIIFYSGRRGRHFRGPPLPYWKGAPRFRGAPFSFYLKSPPPAASGGFLPFRSICRRAATGPQSYFWLRESPAISRRSTRRGRKDWCTRRRSGCSDPAPSGPAQRTADRQTRRPRSAPE